MAKYKHEYADVRRINKIHQIREDPEATTSCGDEAETGGWAETGQTKRVLPA